MPTLRHGLHPEVAAFDAGLVHPASRRHRQAVLWCQQAVWLGEGTTAAPALTGDVAASIASAGATVHAAIDDDDVGKPGMNGRCRVCHQGRADIAGLD